MMILLVKIVGNINLKTLTILAKKLVARLGPERVSADGYITVLQIQMKIRKDERRVKIGSF